MTERRAARGEVGGGEPGAGLPAAEPGVGVGWRARLRPRLWAVIVALVGLVLALPLLSVFALQVIESELVRATEAELFAQTEVLAQAYGVLLDAELRRRGVDGGHYGRPLDPSSAHARQDHQAIAPRLPTLDRRRSPVAAEVAQARDDGKPLDPAAQAAGATLAALPQQVSRRTLAALRVVDVDGHVVASSRAAVGLSIAHWPEVRDGLRGFEHSLLRPRPPAKTDGGFASISRGEGVRVFVSTPVVQQGRVWGVVVGSRTPMDVPRALYQHRAALAIALVGIGVIVVAIFALAVRLLVTPLRALRRDAVAVAGGDRDALQRPGPRGTVEVAELADALAAMAAALDRRAAYLEAFAHNVSHAIKTPLTAIGATVELLADHGESMSAEERQRFLATLAAESSRLQRLAQRLLVLARADVLARRDERADVAGVAEAIAARHRPRLAALAVDVEPGCAVAITAETLDSLLDNLVDNAVHHAGGAQARVWLTARRDGVQVEICVRDDGPGLHGAVADTAFEPFVTTAGGRGGTGLGLAIVRTLARAHGGDVRLLANAAPSGDAAGPDGTDAVAGGATFALRLPAS